MADPARDQRLEELFQEALGLPPEGRAALLEARCGADRELLERVSALLAEDERGTSPILRGDAVHAPGDEGERIGRYRLIRVLGEGGMGTVHLAQQEDPVRRLVALKTIRLGSFSRETAARFASECQALADMNHPGIAKIFDGGLTASGLPYFVMEYAPGLSITEHCDRFFLPLRERLELLARTCDAVQHAHQKGLVHRDLKPGNVLIEVREGEPHPRVIDFGIARALAGHLAPREPSGPLADRLGTPAYMSPSRLAAEGAAPDTRDDVYSLGVILFQLLTGRFPHEGANRAELARALERDPPTPSERLAQQGPDLAEIASERATAPKRLLRSVRGELDALAGCALARDPARRYGTAAALAEDLRRYLAHEPLQAIPRDPLYRARKFLRRHWIGASFVAALLLALVLGLVGTLLALADARAARVEAEKRRAEAEHRRATEQGEREEADLLVRAFKEALLLAQAGEGSGTELSVAELLDVLGDHIDAIGHRSPGAEAALRSALGRCLLAIGADEPARQQFLRAHATGGQALGEDPLDRFDVLEGLIESTRRIGDLPGAQVYVAQAVATAREVFAGHEPRFHAALETLLDLASGASGVADEAALPALEVVLAALPDAIVRGDESGVTARVLIEAAAQLQRRGSPATGPFLAALERRAREILAPEDVRGINFAWSLMHIRLQPGCAVGEETLRAAHELVQAAEGRLPSGHWLRSDAHRLAGQAWLAGQAFEEAEAELLLALAEAGSAPGGGSRRTDLALEELGNLAVALDEHAGPARLGSFLERSWARHREAPEATGAVWWPALLPQLRASLLDAATTLLRSRAEPAARIQLGMLLARADLPDEALRELGRASAPEDEPLLALALRALSLARAERLPEARAELTRLAERRRASPGDPPGLAQLLDDLRSLLGL